MQTTVVNIHHEPYDVYIGRPGHGLDGPWGNPFIPKDNSPEARAFCIAEYSTWIVKQPQLLSQVWKLHGKRLGCFCHPKACHGDVLKALAAAAMRQYEDSIQYGGSKEPPLSDYDNDPYLSADSEELPPGDYGALGTLTDVPNHERY